MLQKRHGAQSMMTEPVTGPHAVPRTAGLGRSGTDAREQCPLPNLRYLTQAIALTAFRSIPPICAVDSPEIWAICTTGQHLHREKIVEVVDSTSNLVARVEGDVKAMRMAFAGVLRTCAQVFEHEDEEIHAGINDFSLRAIVMPYQLEPPSLIPRALGNRQLRNAGVNFCNQRALAAFTPCRWISCELFSTLTSLPSFKDAVVPTEGRPTNAVLTFWPTEVDDLDLRLRLAIGAEGDDSWHYSYLF
jgi:hypothetical protein